MKSSLKALADGLAGLTEGSWVGFVFLGVSGRETGGGGDAEEEEPGKSLWSFAKRPLLCLGDELWDSFKDWVDVPSWLE